MSGGIPTCESALAALPDPVLVAVSGGVDSVALLAALARTGRRPIVLHFDHGWRRESSAEALFVRDLARGLKLKFIAGKMRVASTAKREATARAARYAFFARMAQRLGVTDLALAHHADDQVETFLLQLLRGGGAGAHGMDPVTPRDGLVLHRPWLGLWKKEIVAYARAHRLAWREDATNADPRHRRNLIRHRVLPYLSRTIAPSVSENLWRAAEIRRAESGWLDALCAETAGQTELVVAKLRAEPLARQRRTILRWLQHRGVADLGFAEVETVRGLLDRRDPSRVNLPGRRWARRRAGRIFVE